MIRTASPAHLASAQSRHSVRSRFGTSVALRYDRWPRLSREIRLIVMDGRSMAGLAGRVTPERDVLRGEALKVTAVVRGVACGRCCASNDRSAVTVEQGWATFSTGREDPPAAFPLVPDRYCGGRFSRTGDSRLL